MSSLLSVLDGVEGKFTANDGVEETKGVESFDEEVKEGSGPSSTAGFDPRAAVIKPSNVVRCDQLPGVLNGSNVDPVAAEDLEQVDEMGLPTRRAQAAAKQQNVRDAALLEKERDEARNRALRISDDLDMDEFKFMLPGVPAQDQVLITTSNAAQPPLVVGRQPMVRLLGVAPTIEAAAAEQVRLQEYRNAKGLPLPGKVRCFPTLTWGAVMATQEEQDDLELVQRHVRAVMNRHIWFQNVRCASMTATEEGRMSSQAPGSLFMVFEQAQVEEVPTGKLRKDMLLPIGLGPEALQLYQQRRRARQIQAEEAELKARRIAARKAKKKQGQRASRFVSSADVKAAAAEMKAQEEAKAGHKTMELNEPLPWNSMSMAGNNGQVLLMAELPDMTLHEHLWLDQMNKDCQRLFEPKDKVTKLEPARIFNDDIPRPLFMFLPHCITPGTAEFEAYRTALQPVIEDVDLGDIRCGDWVNPQVRVRDDSTNVVYRTQLQQDILGRNASVHKRQVAEFRRTCEDRGVDQTTLIMGSEETAEQQIQGLLAKLAPYEGVGGRLTKKERHALRKRQAKMRLPCGKPKTRRTRMAINAAGGGGGFLDAAVKHMPKAVTNDGTQS